MSTAQFFFILNFWNPRVFKSHVNILVLKVVLRVISFRNKSKFSLGAYFAQHILKNKYIKGLIGLIVFVISNDVTLFQFFFIVYYSLYIKSILIKFWYILFLYEKNYGNVDFIIETTSYVFKNILNIVGILSLMFSDLWEHPIRSGKPYCLNPNRSRAVTIRIEAARLLFEI